MKIALKNYSILLDSIRKSIAEAEQNIVKEVHHQKILVSWKVGKEIDGHLQKNKDKRYGKKLLEELEKDTGILARTLYQMRVFYKSYPDLSKVEKSLSWSHYRNLVTVRNTEQRKYLEDLTVQKNLDSRELQREVSRLNKNSKSQKTPRKKYTRAQPLPQILKITRGQIALHKIKNKVSGVKGKVRLDLGFNIFLEVAGSFGDGEIVVVKKAGEKILLNKAAAKTNQLYTYKAELERVVDGDTLHVILDLGFGITHHEILRLTQINAPELKTTAGKKSAAALKKILKDVKILVVKTNKTDIYGRYLADVFFSEKKTETDLQKIADRGIYLSQLLLDRNLVEKY